MIETSKLHAYVDGELSDGERREVETRLADCQASQAEVASIQGLKAALGTTTNFDCDEVWANCKSRLDAIDRVAKSGNFITKYSWAFVSAVALVMIIGGGYARHGEARSLDSSSLAGVFSSSSRATPEKISRNAQLDRLLRYADQNLSKVTPISRTEVVVNGQLAIRFDVEDIHGRLILLVLPQVSTFEGMTPNRDGTYYYGQIEAYTNAVGWRTKDAALILVGTRNFASLEDFARTHCIQPE